MSDSHAAHADGPHVSPLSLYLGIFGVLCFLTYVTIEISRPLLITEQLFHGTTGLVVAMGVATVKASLVGAWFMHLKYDTRFNVLVFLGSFWFAAVFFGFTLMDLSTRDRIDPINHHQQAAVDRAAPAAESGGH
jgi:cytochrome c oxidase subunit 4